MFTDLKPYPDYQETVLDRFAGIPVHWEHKRLRYLFREVDVRSSRGTERPLSMSQSLGLVPAEDVQRSLSASSYVGGKLCLPGDIVLNRLKAHLGVFALSRQPGLVSPDYTVLRTIAATDPAYFERLLRSEVLRTELRRRTKGIVEGFWRLYTDDFYDIVVPVPPTDEQAAIVKFLGQANARIDRAIAAKRKLIALLEEQKQAVINQAVTRGLDPDVPMKDSGITWLGTIPAHWSVKRDKWLFHETNTRSSTGTEVLFSLRMRQGLVPHNDVAAVPIPNESLVGYKHVKTGQVVMNRMRAAIGLFGLADSSGLVSPDYATLTPTSEVDPRYFLSLFKTRTAMAEFRRRSTGLGTGSSGFMRLYSEKFGDISVPLPPIQEQDSIITFLQSENLPSDAMITRVNREIELLREFRARLTADVVTGQLDIRDVAARLPELDPADLVSDVGTDEDDFDAVLAASLEVVDA